MSQAGEIILTADAVRSRTTLPTAARNGEFVQLVYDAAGYFTLELASPLTDALYGGGPASYPGAGSATYYEANTYSDAGGPSVVVTGSDMTLLSADRTVSMTAKTFTQKCYFQKTISRDDGSACQAFEAGSIYLIGNPITGVVQAVRGSPNNNAPNLAAFPGFTCSSDTLFVYKLDNTMNAVNLSGYRKGGLQFQPYQSDAVPRLFSGKAGALGSSTVAPTWPAVSMSGYLATNVHRVRIRFGSPGGSAGQAFIAHDSSMLHPAAGQNAPIAFPGRSDGVCDVRWTEFLIYDQFWPNFFVASTISDFFIDFDGFEIE